jgi:hypothetical protein
MPTALGGGRTLRNDLLLIAAILVVGLALLGLLLLRPEGDSVTVRVEGKLYGSYPLDEDVRVEIRTGKNGEHYNLLVIEEGKARVDSASCPDGICAAHRPISRMGESIACKPHGVVVEVKTARTEGGLDVVA